MRVIKQADPKTWRHELDCSGCKSTLEIEIADLERVSDQREGDYAMFTCPVCKRRESMAITKIPSELHYAIPRPSGGYLDR